MRRSLGVSAPMGGYMERKGDGHIYYNATFTNDKVLPQPAKYIDTRSEPILTNPKEWEMSVVRFDTSAALIPISVIEMPVAPPLTNLVVSIIETATSTSQNAIVSLTDHGYSQLGLPAGSVLTYQQLLDDINTALALDFAGIGVPPVGSAPPQFIWNATEQLIDLFVDPSYVATPPALPALQIGISSTLAPFLTGFVTDFQNTAAHPYILELTPSQALLQPAIGARTNLPVSVQAAPATLYKFQQQATVVGLWNKARTILITSSLLPVRPEFVPTNVTSNNNSVSSGTARIISDFLLPPETNPMIGRTILEYLPTAEYRMIDLNGEAPMYSIDMQMFWTDFLGNVYPLILPSGGTFSAKIMFRRIGLGA